MGRPNTNRTLTVADIAIIGGGIVGIATALRLQTDFPGLDILVLEKETALARHQTGHNSGVIHAGIYYAPGSLKAEFCRRGLAATVAFCREHGLPYEQCGKLLVATTEEELARMEALYERATRNEIHLTRLSRQELTEAEPHISGLGALLSPETGIADYPAIVTKMAELFTAAGGEIRYGAKVAGISEGANGVTLRLSAGEQINARRLIVCAGLGADRLASMCGLGGDFAIVPFKGEYYRLAPRHDQIVTHLIYPIPDPALPFLGIHLTRMIGGYVTVGPNAVLSLARESYTKFGFNLGDIVDMARFPGFWKTILANLGSGLDEMANSAFRSRYLRACQKYCPTLELSDLIPHPPGIRAQAVMRDGSLVHDFLIRQTERTIHICNAPSPAATSALPIAELIGKLAAGKFNLTGY